MPPHRDENSLEEMLLGVVLHLTWRVRGERASNLSSPVIAVLNRLRNDGPQPMRVIAETLGLSRPSTTTIVDRMEDMGLVRRERGSSDGREIIVRLTESGDSASTDAHQEAVDLAAALLEGLTAEEAAVIRRALFVLEDALRRPPAGDKGEKTTRIRKIDD
jgi:DNA-binding MarR family transcriptional regulator